ncbi:MAG: alpha/beta fold hydrolase [Chlamydiae bacterium]|nr:alpha/beta fold hydrolase [Chlamydiota bacterium]
MKIFSLFFLIFTICFSLGFSQDQICSGSSTETKALPNSKEVFVKANGAKIFCRVIGKGNPILVIHGGPGLSQDYLLPQMARLGKNNLVIFYDQRGCGLSTGEINADSIRIETFRDDIEAIKKAFGYEKITVLGHSWGCFLAMKYATSHPESIDKLILLSSSPASSEEFSLFTKEFERRMAPYQDKLNAIKKTLEFSKRDPTTVANYYRIMFRKYCYDPQKANLLNLCMSQRATINGLKVSDIFEQSLFSKPYNLHAQLKKINISTLIIHGDYDPIPYVTAQNIHESIHNSKYILIKNCGHFPFIETPDELFKDLNDFLHKP